jgi:small nuclear ribonucleoprotein E
MAYSGVPKVQKVMVQPINLIFRYLQSRTLVSVWLYENVNTRMEGRIIGFDEYMNLVLDDACEVHIKNGSRKQVSSLYNFEKPHSAASFGERAGSANT